MNSHSIAVPSITTIFKYVYEQYALAAAVAADDDDFFCYSFYKYIKKFITNINIDMRAHPHPHIFFFTFYA